MRRAAVIAVAGVAALIVGLGLGQLWVARDGSEPTTSPAELVAVTTSISPTTHAFGDPINARADVLVDTREVDPESVMLQPDFGPYKPVAPPSVSRKQVGDLGRIRFEYRLVCLQEGCDTAGAHGVSDFPSGRVRYEFKGQRGNAFEAFDWPLLVVASRVADSDVENIRWRSDATTLVAPTYRVSAVGAALVLLAIALACIAAAVALARHLWWRAAAGDAGVVDAAMSRTALEQAFDVALRADGSDASDRRRALERAARELGSAGRADLAGEARALAWAPGPSSADQVSRLAARAGVQPALGGNA